MNYVLYIFDFHFHIIFLLCFYVMYFFAFYSTQTWPWILTRFSFNLRETVFQIMDNRQGKNKDQIEENKRDNEVIIETG